MTTTTRAPTRRTKGTTARVLAAASAAVALLGASLTFVTSGALATPADKIEICHATSSVTNPYTMPEVDMSSVDEFGNAELNGHGDHVGPVFTDEMTNGDTWGDIIPAFTYTFTTWEGTGPDRHEVTVTVVFEGLNWNDAGRAIHDNGCQPVTPSPPPPVYYDASTPVCVPTDSAWTPGTLSVPQEYLTQEEAGAALVEKAATDATGLMIPPFGDFAGSANYDAAIYNNGTCLATPPTTPPTTQVYSATQPYCALVDAAAGTYAAATLTATGDSQVTADAALKTQAGALTAGIVPAFGVGNNAFAGLNWGVDGQAIYANGCVVPPVEVAPTVVEPGVVEPGVVTPEPGTVVKPAEVAAGLAGAPEAASVPAAIPAGDGSSVPQTPAWVLAMLALGTVGLLASTSRLVAVRVR